MYDVIIVGGGVAGLSAALLLGRSRRRTLVCDAGRPRNSPSRALNGFLTRDGVAPGELLRLGREQLRPYDTVEARPAVVAGVERDDEGFRAELRDGSAVRGRKLLLATGLVDELPSVEGAAELFGRRLFHCPYCDGWEVRHGPLAAYGRGKAGAAMALDLLGWSEDVALCSDGPAELSARQRSRMKRLGVGLYEQPIERLAEAGEGLRVVFEDGASLERQAMFVKTVGRQRSELAASLGCRLDEHGQIEVRPDTSTGAPGVYAAGDATGAPQLAIVAAAEGARAALAINAELLKEGLAAREGRPRARPARSGAL
jgi:thioredoxin reductase